MSSGEEKPCVCSFWTLPKAGERDFSQRSPPEAMGEVGFHTQVPHPRHRFHTQVPHPAPGSTPRFHTQVHTQVPHPGSQLRTSRFHTQRPQVPDWEPWVWNLGARTMGVEPGCGNWTPEPGCGTWVPEPGCGTWVWNRGARTWVWCGNWVWNLGVALGVEPGCGTNAVGVEPWRFKPSGRNELLPKIDERYFCRADAGGVSWGCCAPADPPASMDMYFIKAVMWISWREWYRSGGAAPPQTRRFFLWTCILLLKR